MTTVSNTHDINQMGLVSLTNGRFCFLAGANYRPQMFARPGFPQDDALGGGYVFLGHRRRQLRGRSMSGSI